MLQVNELSKKMYGNPLFEGASFKINTGEKVALAGSNGTGKSTMLKLIMGQEGLDAGTIVIPKSQKISYLSQKSVVDSTETVYDYIFEGQKEIKELGLKLGKIEVKLGESESADFDKVLGQYGRLQEEYLQRDGYVIQELIESMTTGLGIRELLNLPMVSLSGGQQTLVKLARCLLEKHPILLLDEPTNHLDQKGLSWLENYLKYSQQTVLIVSHDRYFLDQVVEKVLLIDHQKITTYKGNYTTFKEKRSKELEILAQQFVEQQKEVKKTKDAIRRFRHWGAISDNEQHFKKAKRLEKQLANKELINKPIDSNQRLKAQQFQTEERSGKEVLLFDEVTKSFGKQSLFKPLNFQIFWQDRVGIQGDNGAGKTTLLKLILEEEGITTGVIKKGTRLKTGYLPQVIIYENEKDSVLSYFKEQVALDEETARRVLSYFKFTKEDVFKQVGFLSGGEKVRLELACLMNQGINCLILDEPTNHLDIESREWLEEQLENYSGTLIFVSHDRYFFNRLSSKKIILQKEG